MSTTTPKPVTTPIPVQLSEPEFSAFILPHLSMPKRGPKCKLGYYRVFNLILRVLYTGMQWKCLPVPHDPQGKPAIHDTTVRANRLFTTRPSTKSLPNWRMMARSGRRLWPVCGISRSSSSSISACSMATAPTPWRKKGRWDCLFGVQASDRGEGHRHD